MTKLQQKTLMPVIIFIISLSQLPNFDMTMNDPLGSDLILTTTAVLHSSELADPQMYNSAADLSNHTYTDHAIVVLMTLVLTGSHYTQAY